MRIRASTAGVLALSLALQPLPSSSSSTLGQQRLIDRCAHRAQHKQRRNHSATAFDSSSMWHRLGNALSGQNETSGRGGGRHLSADCQYDKRVMTMCIVGGALFCRTGNWLEMVGETGERIEVRGTRKENSKFTLLEFLAVAFGLVSIRSVTNHHYLCMDSSGQLYAAPASRYSADCVFMEEMMHNYYNLYSSCAYGSARSPWFIALRRTGQQRRGRHSRRRQKSSHFVIVETTNSNSKTDGSTVLDGFGHSKTRVGPWAWKYFYDLYSSTTHHHRQKHPRRGRKKLRWELPKEVILLDINGRHRRTQRT
uniref:Putative effector protein n=1 Tax=Heterodera avenae TaxID=34510 RepID=A0A2L0VDI9_HETAV|nr:putative effector protein [Heterodera avenae]